MAATTTGVKLSLLLSQFDANEKEKIIQLSNKVDSKTKQKICDFLQYVIDNNALKAAELLADDGYDCIAALALIHNINTESEFFIKMLSHIETTRDLVILGQIKLALLNHCIIQANLPLLVHFFGDGTFHRFISRKTRCQPSTFARDLYYKSETYHYLTDDSKNKLIEFLKRHCDMPLPGQTKCLVTMPTHSPVSVDMSIFGSGSFFGDGMDVDTSTSPAASLVIQAPPFSQSLFFTQHTGSCSPLHSSPQWDLSEPGPSSPSIK